MAKREFDDPTLKRDALALVIALAEHDGPAEQAILDQYVGPTAFRVNAALLIDVLASLVIVAYADDPVCEHLLPDRIREMLQRFASH